jgi:uncharacterized membrane protein YtjA (UPF0391 family)
MRIEKATKQWCVVGTHLARRLSNQVEERLMLYYALMFVVVAIVAGVLGFGGIAGAATDIARVLFFVFLVLLLVSLFAGRAIL